MRLFPPARVDEFLAAGLWSGDTWGDALARHVVERGDRICMVDACDKPSFMAQQPRRVTWSELDAASQRCAAVLFDHGVREGDVVGIQIPNSIELAITYFALVRLGAILSPYPMPYRHHEVAQLAEIADVAHFVTTGGYSKRDLEADISAVIADVDSARTMFVWHMSRGVDGVGLDVDADPAQPVVDACTAYVDTLTPHPNDCVLIMFTSGTTGVPKGVPRTHGGLLFGGATNVAAPRMTADSVLLNSMPMVNAGSIGGIFMPWLVSGCCVVQHQPFDLDVFVAQIEQEHVTYTVVAPTILNDMASDPAIWQRHDLSSLTTVGAGSAPLSGWSIECWEKEHGVEIVNFFGATEGMQLTSDPDTVPDPMLRGRCLPVPRSPRFRWRQPVERQPRIRLVDIDTGADIDTPGTPGELRFTSPSTFSGYLHAVENPFDDQGYFCTGEIFEYSGESGDMLVHVDRKKDLIIRGGVNISAAEIETLLAGHPQIAEVAAVGRKDRRLGERTCVFVVPRDEDDPPSLDSLVRHLTAQDVATFKLPESIELIDELPRNPSGKVLKRELRIRINDDDRSI